MNRTLRGVARQDLEKDGAVLLSPAFCARRQSSLAGVHMRNPRLV